MRERLSCLFFLIFDVSGNWYRIVHINVKISYFSYDYYYNSDKKNFHGYINTQHYTVVYLRTCIDSPVPKILHYTYSPHYSSLSLFSLSRV
jgi:hypothetical protein